MYVSSWALTILKFCSYEYLYEMETGYLDSLHCMAYIHCKAILDQNKGTVEYKLLWRPTGMHVSRRRPSDCSGERFVICRCLVSISSTSRLPFLWNPRWRGKYSFYCVTFASGGAVWQRKSQIHWWRQSNAARSSRSLVQFRAYDICSWSLGPRLLIFWVRSAAANCPRWKEEK